MSQSLVRSPLVCVLSIHDARFLLHGPLLCSYSNFLPAQPPKSTLCSLLLSGMPWLIGRCKLLRQTETLSGLGVWSPTGLAQWLTCMLCSAQMKRPWVSNPSFVIRAHFPPVLLAVSDFCPTSKFLPSLGTELKGQPEFHFYHLI